MKIRQLSYVKNQAYKSSGTKVAIVKALRKDKDKNRETATLSNVLCKFSYPNNFNYSVSTMKLYQRESTNLTI